MTTIQVRENQDNEPLTIGDGAILRQGIVLASGHSALDKGTVLAESPPTSGTYIPCDVALLASGGGFPKLVLAQDVVSASGQTTTSGYETALLAESKLSFGGTTDLDSRVVIVVNNIDLSMRDAMRMVGLSVASDISVTGYENAVV